MLPNCHLCVVIGSSPVAFYFFVCTCCGLLVVCAWCACRDAMGGEYRLRGSPRSERAASRRNSSRRDEIRRAKIVSRSLATAKVITAAMKIAGGGPPSEIDAYCRDHRPPRASPESSSPHAVTLVLTDDERGPESAPEDRTTDGTSVIVVAKSRLVLDSTGWEVDACAICTGPYEENDVVSYSKKQRCRHNFHPECIQTWLKVKDDCPCCRSPYV